ncbi:MAG: PHP domain-containing protein [Syntrophomonadaceae bacterium]|nr:PHP domain-containing protein [Syntrophomonadaceae bacterium]
MLIDTHLHESKYSLDSNISLREIIVRAKEIGLDGVCITDHESNDIAEEAGRLAKEMNFPIFVGAEILTFEGDMTVFGVTDLPKRILSAQELLDYVISRNGIAICSHPYRENGRSMGDVMKGLINPIGIEAFNGSTPEELNMKAYQVALDMNLPALGGSDAHDREQVGKFATLFPKGTRTMCDFIAAIKANEVFPAFYDKGHYHVVYGVDQVSQAM